MFRQVLIAAVVIATVSLAACEPDTGQPVGGSGPVGTPPPGSIPTPPVSDEPVDTTPRPTAIGTPIGPERITTVGTEGGTATSIDGAVSVVIPAGALVAATPISVQRITGHAPGSLRSYALRPEGQTFAVPVKLQFSFDEFDVDGTVPEALDIGYQDASGFWRALPGAALDAQNRTVSVATTHFSDWALLSTIKLTPQRAAVRVNAKLALNVVSCGRKDDPATGLPALVETCGPSPLRVDTWAVNGTTYGDARVGSVDSAGTIKGQYTAPANKPSPAKVAVSCAVQLPAGDRAKVLLKTEVQVVDHAGWNGSIWYSMRGEDGSIETVTLPGNTGTQTTEKSRMISGSAVFTIEAETDIGGPTVMKVSKVDGSYRYREAILRDRTNQDGPCLRISKGSTVTTASAVPAMPLHNLLAIEFGNATMAGGDYRVMFAPTSGHLIGTTVEQSSQTASGNHCVPALPTDVRVDYEGSIDVVSIDLKGTSPDKAESISGVAVKESTSGGLPVIWEVHWQLNNSVN